MSGDGGSINPIETKYQGYLFRSRLEARWAVFLDTLGLHWTYEPEGYDLGPAGYYLPDFKVTVIAASSGGALVKQIWVEIKPERPTDEELAKLWALCKGTGMIGYLMDGDPLRADIHIGGAGRASARVVGIDTLCRIFGTEKPETLHAAHAARIARFEHGESGATGVWTHG